MNINTLIKECLVEKGAGNYVGFLPLYVEELIHTKVEKKTRALESDMKKMITDAVLKRAFKAHTAHVAQQQKEKNQPTQKGTNPNESVQS